VWLNVSAPTPITVCSVSFNSRPWLELNHQLARRLNADADLTWLVAENSPNDSALHLQWDDPRFRVVPGAPFEQRPYASGSYHHGAGMNVVLPRIATRYVLFTDPDFFIIKVGWARNVIGHMSTRKLGVFGAPWHPRWVYKNRYFPCVHCMFVDLERVPVEWLDFRPDYPTVPDYARTPDSVEVPTTKLPDPLKLRKRRNIGSSRDVGWLIAQRASADPPVRVECLQPVFRPERRTFQSLVDRLLPDRLSLVPKRPGYFTERRFRDFGLPDLEARGWEEFLWRGDPFGFHVRSQPKVKGGQPLEDHLAAASEVLQHFPIADPRSDRVR
jgi:hypothetical protein